MLAALFSRARLPLIALLTANAGSMLGNVFALIAIPWYVLETTGSASRAGLIGFAAALPIIIAGVFGGAMVDRVGFRRMSVFSDLVSSLVVAAIPLLALTVGLAFWQLLALVFVGCLLDTPGTTARMSLLPDLASRGEAQLERVNATEQLIQRGAFLLGAPLAGVVIAALGAHAALWLNAASFVISAVLIVVLVPSARAGVRERQTLASFREDLVAGLAFIRRRATQPDPHDDQPGAGAGRPAWARLWRHHEHRLASDSCRAAAGRPHPDTRWGCRRLRAGNDQHVPARGAA